METRTRDWDHVLAHTRSLWEDFRGEQVLVTGGTGFFGRWLLTSFAHANRVFGLDARVVALSRHPDSLLQEAPDLAADPSVALVRGDVRTFDFDDLRRAGRSGSSRFAFVIHAAAEASARLSREDPLTMADVVTLGTRRVLDFAAHAGTRRFLFVSSGAVYGPQPPELPNVDEQHLGRLDCWHPEGVYAEAKRMAEMLCRCYAQQHGLPVICARPFAFVGPYMKTAEHFAVGNFIRDALRNEPIVVRGDGTPSRSYLYAADLAIWLWTMLSRGAAGAVYNVGSPQPVTILELARTVERVLGAKRGVQVAGTPVPGAAPARYVPSVEKARRELGLVPTISLEAGIDRTAEWLRTGG